MIWRFGSGMNRLNRSETNRMISGVCAGVARYIALDVTWIRLAFIVLALASGLGFFLYLILAILIPGESDEARPAGEVIGRNVDDLFGVLGGWVERLRQTAEESPTTAVLLILLGVFFLFSQLGWASFRGLGLVLLLALGIYYYARSRRE